MLETSNIIIVEFNNFYVEAKKYWKILELLIAVIFILIGLIISFVVAPQIGIWKDIVYNLGIFISTIFSVQLIYEIIFKKNDQEFFKAELINVWEEKIPEIIESGITFYEEGRRPEDEKLEFYQKAQTEIIEVAATLHSFSNKFSSAQDSKFKEPILALMKKGVNIKLFLLNPESESASAYQKCTPVDDNVMGKIGSSIENLQKNIQELNQKSDSGKIELYTYDYIPLLNGVFIDFVEDPSINPRAFVSHYLPYMEKRSENPGFYFTKKQNLELYQRYFHSVEELKKNANLVDNKSVY